MCLSDGQSYNPPGICNHGLLYSPLSLPPSCILLPPLCIFLSVFLNIHEGHWNLEFCILPPSPVAPTLTFSLESVFWNLLSAFCSNLSPQAHLAIRWTLETGIWDFGKVATLRAAEPAILETGILNLHTWFTEHMYRNISTKTLRLRDVTPIQHVRILETGISESALLRPTAVYLRRASTS